MKRSKRRKAKLTNGKNLGANVVTYRMEKWSEFMDLMQGGGARGTSAFAGRATQIGH